MDSSLHKHMTELRAAGDRNVSLAEIADIVESVMKGLEGEVFGMDIRVFGELEALSEAIKSARSELSTLSPEDIYELNEFIDVNQQVQQVLPTTR